MFWLISADCRSFVFIIIVRMFTEEFLCRDFVEIFGHLVIMNLFNEIKIILTYYTYIMAKVIIT